MEKIALPFSYEYIKVLELVSVIASSVYYFYFMWLFGSVLIAFYLEFIKRDDVSTYLADKFLTLPLKRFSIPFVLGIMSILVITSLEIVLFQESKYSIFHDLNILLNVILIVGLIFSGIYKYTFKVINLLPKSVVDQSSRQFIQFMQSNIKAHKLSARGALIFLIISFLFLSTIMTYKINYALSGEDVGFFSYLFNFYTMIRFLELVTFSLVISFLTTFFLSSIWKEREFESSHIFQEKLKKITVDLGLVLILPIPFLLIIDSFLLPTQVLSFGIFVSLGLAILLLFVIVNQLNAFKKEETSSLGAGSFYLLVFVVILFSLKDTITFSNALEPSIVNISKDFASYEENLKSKLNIATIKINPEEIFNSKCIVCHQFETKSVGPPYNAVLPKYEANKEQLVKFILNPIKVDPAYPPMPAQGLLPSEAEAVADYLLTTYKQKLR